MRVKRDLSTVRRNTEFLSREICDKLLSIDSSSFHPNQYLIAEEVIEGLHRLTEHVNAIERGETERIRQLNHSHFVWNCVLAVVTVVVIAVVVGGKGDARSVSASGDQFARSYLDLVSCDRFQARSQSRSSIV